MILDLRRLPILETERLRLDPLTPEDIEDLFPIMGEAEVMAFWDVPEADDPDIAAQVVRTRVEEMQGGRAVHWTIRRLDDGQVVGSSNLTDIDRRHRRAELGVVLRRDVWGREYALETLSTVVAFAAASGLRKLAARTQLGNRRAEAPLLQLGFEEEGLLRGHLVRDGERRDCRLFGLLL